MSDDVRRALQTRLRPSYENVRRLAKGSGGSAILFLADFATTDAEARRVPTRAIKVLSPEMATAAGRESFKKEISILVGLNHPHFLKIYESGKISMGRNKLKLPFYVTDFCEKGTLRKYLSHITSPDGRFRAVVETFGQILSALEHAHTGRRIAHLDLKESNVLVTERRRGAPEIRVIDLGSAAEIGSGADELEILSTKENWPRSYQVRFGQHEPTNPRRARIRLQKKDALVAVDLHMLFRMFATLKEQIGEVSPEYQDEWTYFSSALDRLNCDDPRPGDLLSSARLTLGVLQKWKARDTQTAFLREGYLRIPLFGIRHFAEPIRDVVDTALFQRLRRVDQLALVSLAFPGGTHTRFEHSLGAMETSLQYIDALCSNGNAPWFLQNIARRQIEVAALYALLHDAGHYAFSHVIDAIVPSGRHESVLKRLLGRDASLMAQVPNAKTYIDELEKVLRRRWAFNGLAEVVPYFDFLANRGLEQIAGVADVSGQHMWRVLRDIVNGPIDADKLDYLQRDGHHCGVPFADAIDRDRLFASLSVDRFRGRRPHLIVTHKGRACAESLAVARYMLFSEVYWGHSARSFTAMLEACVGRLLERHGDADEVLFGRLGLFAKSDEEALVAITERLKTFAPAKGLAMRRPFKRLLVLSPVVEGDKDAYGVVSKARGDRRQAEAGWEKFQKGLKEHICRQLLGKGSNLDDLLIDVPDPGKYNFEELMVTSELDPDQTHEIGPLWRSVREAFSTSARKIRIFGNQDVLRQGDGGVQLAKRARELILNSAS